MTSTHPRHDLDDLLIHAVRFSIAALVGVDRAEFGLIRDSVDISDSMLSKQIALLEAAGYVGVDKAASAGCRGPGCGSPPSAARRTSAIWPHCSGSPALGRPRRVATEARSTPGRVCAGAKPGLIRPHRSASAMMGRSPRKGDVIVGAVIALSIGRGSAAPAMLPDSDGDDIVLEYGYVWLPYAVAALVLFALGALVALRSRRSSRRTPEVLFTSGAVLAVLAAVILGLADGATEGNGLASVDRPLWQWMIDHRTPGLSSTATAITEIGGTVSMTIVATAVVLVLLIDHRRGDAALVAVVSAGAGVLVTVGKATVGRERPPLEYRLVTETNESFPSGHALASAAILGVVLVVLLPSITSTAARVAVVTAVGVFVLAVGLSRVYLGVHWATDVLGGWVTGLAWLWFGLTVRRVWRRRRSALPA